MSRKAELKAAYKQNWHRLRTMGVYQIQNQVTGKRFLGAGLNLEGTMERDRFWLSQGNHLNKALQQDWQAHGPEAFRCEVLETLTPTDGPRDYADELAILLEAWSEQLEPWGDKGYLPQPRR